MIGKLLGHNLVQTTARHAHLQLHSVRTAAERVADSRTCRNDAHEDCAYRAIL